MEAATGCAEYMRDLIGQRRSAPGEDLMSGLIRVEESGDQLTEEEIIATCNLLLVAGHETTVNLIANAILACCVIRASGPRWEPTRTVRPRSWRRRCATTRRYSLSGELPPPT